MRSKEEIVDRLDGLLSIERQAVDLDFPVLKAEASACVAALRWVLE